MWPGLAEIHLRPFEEEKSRGGGWDGEEDASEKKRKGGSGTTMLKHPSSERNLALLGFVFVQTCS